MSNIFKKWEVSQGMLHEMPHIIMGSPDLVVQIEDKFYDWKNAAPLIMAYLVYKTSLPVGSVESLNEVYLQPEFDFNPE
jgi:hypothetical protein